MAYSGYRDLVQLLYWRACLRINSPTHPRLDPLNTATVTKSSFGIWLRKFFLVWSTTASDLTLERLLFFIIYMVLARVFDESPAVVHISIVASNPSKNLVVPDLRQNLGQAKGSGSSKLGASRNPSNS